MADTVVIIADEQVVTVEVAEAEVVVTQDEQVITVEVAETEVVVTQDEQVVTVEVAEQGPQGIQGVPGADGTLAIGEAVAAGTPGSLLLVDAAGDLAQENGALHWDAANKRLGVGTVSPDYAIKAEGLTAQDGGISAQGALNIDLVDDPPNATALALGTGGGMDIGTHHYRVTFVTALGETHGAYQGKIVTDAVSNKVLLTDIPVSTDPRVTSRKIYRSKVTQNYSDNAFYFATINDNTTTTFTDTYDDTYSTGTAYMGSYRPNTTSKFISIDGVSAMVLDSNRTVVGQPNGGVLSGDSFVTSFGAQNLQRATSTSNCLVFGSRNLLYLTTGKQNHVFGELCCAQVTTGYGNLVLGSQSMRFGNGIYNTAVGHAALVGTSGVNVIFNTGLGLSAGAKAGSGSYNTFLGARSGYTGQLSNASWSMALGAYAWTDKSYQYTYGYTNTIEHLFRAGTVKINPYVPSLPGQIITGAVSQTANLAEYHDSAGNVLSCISAAGEVEVMDSTLGIVLKSPDGTRWRIQVDNTGALSTTST